MSFVGSDDDDSFGGIGNDVGEGAGVIADDDWSCGEFTTDTNKNMDFEDSNNDIKVGDDEAPPQSSSSTISFDYPYHLNRSNNNVQEDDPVSVEQILARELNKLSVQERVQAMEDVHGISGTLHVDAETAKAKLIELDEYISKHKTKLYKLAESLSSNYVQCPDFRLQFLQADLFEVQAAAQRLFKFVEYKYKLFGRDKLVQDIRITDLSEGDMKLLEHGVLQVLLEQDSAGRPVIMCFTQLEPIKDIGGMLRVVYYVFMSVIASYPEVRTKGFVWVFYNTQERPTQTNPKLAWKCLKLRHSLPIRTVTNHFCTRNGPRPVFRVLLAMWYRINRSYTRVRVRRHAGNDEECRNHLRAFGLPMEYFPVDDHGVMHLEFHREWIRRRKQVEEAQGKGLLPAITSRGETSATTTTENYRSGEMSLDTTQDDENNDDDSIITRNKIEFDLRQMLQNQGISSPTSNRHHCVNTVNGNGISSSNSNVAYPNPQLPTTLQGEMNNISDRLVRMDYPEACVISENNDSHNNHNNTVTSSSVLPELPMNGDILNLVHQSENSSSFPLPPVAIPNDTTSSSCNNNYNFGSNPNLFNQSYYNHTPDPPLMLPPKMFTTSSASRSTPPLIPNHQLHQPPQPPPVLCPFLTPDPSPEPSPLLSTSRKIIDSSKPVPNTISPPSPFNHKSINKSNNSSASAASASGSVVFVNPTPKDVLFGRGKPTRNHPGNVQFRNLLEAHNEEYNRAPKFVKCMIAKTLVQTLSNSGSRFLKPHSNPNGTGWVIADEKTAQDKVSQYFRSRRGLKS